MKTIIVIASVAVVLGMGAYLYATPQPSQVHQATPVVVPPSPASAQSSVRPASHPSPSAVTPNVGTPSTTPSLIVVNTPTTVTVTVSIAPTPLANGVNLLRLGATGTQPTILGVMHDDGKNGDVLAGDSIYSLQVAFDEPMAGQIQLQTSVAFSGILKRILSLPSSVSIWQGYSNPQIGVSFLYPNAFSVTSDSINNIVNLKADAQPAVSVLTLAASSQAPIDPDTWFRTQVDQDGLLLSSGSVHRQINSDGSVLYIFLSSPGPAYIDSHGPLPFAIVVSNDGSRVTEVLGSSEGDALNSLGFSEVQAEALRLSVIESIRMR